MIAIQPRVSAGTLRYLLILRLSPLTIASDILMSPGDFGRTWNIAPLAQLVFLDTRCFATRVSVDLPGEWFLNRGTRQMADYCKGFYFPGEATLEVLQPPRRISSGDTTFTSSF